MRGRPRKPTALKIAEGNPGRRPLNEAEPKPTGKPTEPPAHLKGVARRHWFRMVPMLDAVLTDWDEDALARYCVAYGRWVKAEEAIAKEGEVIVSPKGYPIQSAWLPIANKAMEQMAAEGAKFGLTPSDRVRLHVKPADDGGKSEDERMFGT